MKKIKLFLLLFLVVVLSGCVKYDLTMAVDVDKSINIILIDAIHKDYYTDDEGVTESSYKEHGFEVEKYEDDTHIGYKLSRKYDNIDQISSEDCGRIELTDLLTMDLETLILFKKEKIDTITTYTADFTYDLTVEETNSQTGNEEIDYSEYTDEMSFKYTIVFPTNSNIINSNADEKSDDGYTQSWNIKYGELKEIEFSFSIDDRFVKPSEETPDINNNGNTEQTPSEEKNEENEPIVEDETPTENSTGFRNVILFAILIIIVFGLVIVKIKVKQAPTTTSKYHKEPPRNN